MFAGRPPDKGESEGCLWNLLMQAYRLTPRDENGVPENRFRNKNLLLSSSTLVPDIFHRGPVDPCTKLNLLAVWRYNCGYSRVTSVGANDLLIAGFLAFNDVQGTELVAGILGNLDHSCRAKRLILLEVLR